MRLVWCLFIFSLGCSQKQNSDAESSVVNSDTTSHERSAGNTLEEKNYNYAEFIGIYDHESNTKGFSAMLSIRQNGNDLYFHVSVAQGNCKGETEGVAMMVEQTQYNFSGFYESDDCRLQFTFIKADKKIEIKEITLCKILASGCSYEGTYSKRKS